MLGVGFARVAAPWPFETWERMAVRFLLSSVWDPISCPTPGTCRTLPKTIASSRRVTNTAALRPT
jgi:hypothetical protein